MTCAEVVCVEATSGAAGGGVGLAADTAGTVASTMLANEIGAEGVVVGALAVGVSVGRVGYVSMSFLTVCVGMKSRGTVGVGERTGGVWDTGGAVLGVMASICGATAVSMGLGGAVVGGAVVGGAVVGGEVIRGEVMQGEVTVGREGYIASTTMEGLTGEMTEPEGWRDAGV